MSPIEKMYTTREVAGLLGYSVHTIRVMRVRGTGPKYKKAAGKRSRVLYPESYIRKYIAQLPTITPGKVA